MTPLFTLDDLQTSLDMLWCCTRHAPCAVVSAADVKLACPGAGVLCSGVER